MANYCELSFKSSGEIGTLIPGYFQHSSVLPTTALSESISNVNLSFSRNIFIWVLVRDATGRLPVARRTLQGVHYVQRHLMTFRVRVTRPERRFARPLVAAAASGLPVRPA